MHNFKIVHCLFLCVFLRLWAHSSASWAIDWKTVRTDQFRFIYQPQYAHIVPNVILCAQAALDAYAVNFNYTPTETINVIIRDIRDIGGGSATTLPHNIIKIEIAPFDLDYEFTRFDHQFQWLLSHELMHIAMSDQCSQSEKFFRAFFGKVAPLREEPLTMPFGILTNYNRFTPSWHQEGIAVFMETWLNGGYGRVLGSFDEMFFRTLVYEKCPFMNKKAIDFGDDDSFLLGSTSYLYGARFITWLTLKYGLDHLLDWMSVPHDALFNDYYKRKFKSIYHSDLHLAWKSFFEHETAFQNKNIERLKKYPPGTVKKLAHPMGWVTQGYPDKTGQYLYFGSHRPHHFAALIKLDLQTGETTTLHTMPTPKLVGVASTAFDPEFGFFFFTTHNERGYRDIWAVDVKTGANKLVFRDTRLGAFCIHPRNHSLWGIRVHNGLSVLCFSPFPYRKIVPLFTVNTGTILTHPAISPDGKDMAATLHHQNGSQEIIVLSLEQLVKEERFLYRTVSAEGHPEHPAWSADGKTLYWNACISGVSNIFSRQEDDSTMQAKSNVYTGLFHPVCLPDNRLAAFIYTARGFQPCVLPDAPVPGLAAIEFLGQRVVEKYPKVRTWRLQQDDAELKQITDLPEKRYIGLLDLKHNSLIPTIGAFQEQVAGGLFWDLADPLYYHQINLHAGFYSSYIPFFLFRYAYKDIFTLTAQKSPASFFDLLNRRQVNQPGKNILVEYKKWWIWDMPSTREQWLYLHWGEGLTDTGDEQQKMSLGRILSAGTRLKHRHMRKSIGSVDDEKGFELNADIRYSRTIRSPGQTALFVGADFHVLHPVFRPHNIFRVGLSAGYTQGDDLYTCLSYFGGFGNRFIEDRIVNRYREVSAFPGLAYRRHAARDYAKVAVENMIPPIHIQKALGPLYAEKLDMGVFSQFLVTHSGNRKFLSTGARINLCLKKFFVLESVLSCGYASSYRWGGGRFDEFFITLNVLGNPND